ncbi:branched-chain amino acid ABC transporter permease [Haloglomus salinum]|jgi:branched-chain amino acid transport system permease protein|uniref:branched-chain amino acid ABC transporter permease n=1 Tax=Haloglomus salinum TaxID=2962673 RepID=UPI0020C9631F|nr:branched-chain amino acid ABC transporter permease [Haloglomus salinum]
MAVSPITVGINVLMLGALYALIAVGFTLIFGVGGILNLAHGAFLTIGGYVAFYIVDAGQNVALAIPIAAVVAGVAGVALYKGVLKKVSDNPVSVLILSLVAGLLVEQVFLILEGGEPKILPGIVEGSLALGGASVQSNRLLVFIASWVVIGALFYFVNRTKTGQAILATSMSRKGAAIVGIDADRVFTLTWILAAALAGIAGVFLATFQSVNPLMGRNPLLLSFSIVVLGGLGSIRGSIVGAYVISFLDQITVQYIDSQLAGVSGLIVLVAVLILRPEGLFGRELTEG